ncbi:hypothetical protein [Streptomyces sp. NPDC007205]|uniref:hypothetical protein n=1 Tax=Streptomyces sp. NPDC007205 TaxID=3154316 RepID=UPI0033F6AF73
MRTGLRVLPEPLVVVNRTGSLSDTKAFGWQFTQHLILPTAQYSGVRVTTFMDRDARAADRMARGGRPGARVRKPAASDAGWHVRDAE